MKRWLMLSVLVITCLIVYWFIRACDFQQAWDDQWMVMNRYTQIGFTWDNITNVFTEFFHGQYGPINELMYMIIYALFGYNPAIYHLYPVIIHIINSCLVLLFVERLIEGRVATNAGRWISFVTALLFAVHPLQVESISWISASKIPLYTMFVLLAMLTYIRFVRTEKIKYYIYTFLLFVCAFGSKEQCVVFPATLLLVDWALNRMPIPCGMTSDEPNKMCSWSYIFIEKLPFFLFAFLGAFLTYSQVNPNTTADWAGYPLDQRFVFGCYSFVEYLGKLAAPINLLYIYPFPIAPGLPLPVRFFIYPIITIAAIALLVYWLRGQNWLKHWPIIFGLLFFLINMALVLHVVAMPRFFIIADRYVYLGSVGIFFIAAWYIVPWLQKEVSSGRKWLLAFPIAYLLYLGGYAHYRTYAWKDSDTLKKELQELIHPETLKNMQETAPPEQVAPKAEQESNEKPNR